MKKERRKRVVDRFSLSLLLRLQSFSLQDNHICPFARSFVVLLLLVFCFYRRECTRRESEREREKNSETRLTPYISLSRAYTGLVHNNTFLSATESVLSSVYFVCQHARREVYLVLGTILYKSMHWVLVAYFSHSTATDVVVNCVEKRKTTKDFLRDGFDELLLYSLSGSWWKSSARASISEHRCSSFRFTRCRCLFLWTILFLWNFANVIGRVHYQFICYQSIR